VQLHRDIWRQPATNNSILANAKALKQQILLVPTYAKLVLSLLIYTPSTDLQTCLCICTGEKKPLSYTPKPYRQRLIVLCNSIVFSNELPLLKRSSSTLLAEARNNAGIQKAVSAWLSVITVINLANFIYLKMNRINCKWWTAHHMSQSTVYCLNMPLQYYFYCILVRCTVSCLYCESNSSQCFNCITENILFLLGSRNADRDDIGAKWSRGKCFPIGKNPSINV